MDKITKHINNKAVYKINQFVNALQITGNKRQLGYIKFVDIYLDHNRIPSRVLLTYDNEDLNDPNSFKGSQLPHKLLIFDKSPIIIPENISTQNKEIEIRKNKFTGEILLCDIQN
jgi:hypothetical protein